MQNTKFSDIRPGEMFVFHGVTYKKLDETDGASKKINAVEVDHGVCFSANDTVNTFTVYPIKPASMMASIN